MGARVAAAAATAADVRTTRSAGVDPLVASGAREASSAHALGDVAAVGAVAAVLARVRVAQRELMAVVVVTATSTSIFRVLPLGSADTGETGMCNRGERNCPDGEQPTTDLSTCALVVNASDAETFAVRPRLPGNGLLIGQFALADGHTALLPVNQNWGSTLWPIFSFSRSANNAAAAGILEVDPGSGEEALVFDDSPGVDATGARFHSLGSIQLAFGAAVARLPILPRHG